MKIFVKARTRFKMGKDKDEIYYNEISSILDNDGNLDYEKILKDIEKGFIPYKSKELSKVVMITDIKILTK